MPKLTAADLCFPNLNGPYVAVIPAKAGISARAAADLNEIPVCTGMTGKSHA